MVHRTTITSEQVHIYKRKQNNITVYIETKQNYCTKVCDCIGFNNLHGRDHIGCK